MSALIEKVQQFAVLESCGCWRWTGAKQARGSCRDPAPAA